MSQSKADADWKSIEAEYCAGILRVSEIARQFGVNESTIRSRAKRGNWVRLSASMRAKEVKKKVGSESPKKVSQQVASTKDGNVVSITGDNAADIMNSAIDQDVQDMNLGLKNARAALRKAGTMIDDVDDPRDLDTLSKVTKNSIDTIRKIRGLDEKDPEDDLSNKSIEELQAEIDRLQNTEA